MSKNVQYWRSCVHKKTDVIAHHFAQGRSVDFTVIPMNKNNGTPSIRNKNGKHGSKAMTKLGKRNGTKLS